MGATLTSCLQHAKNLFSCMSNTTSSLPVLYQPAEAPTVDISEHVAEQVRPMAFAIAAGLFTLLANQPTSVHNHIALYKIYLLFYLLSFALTIVPLLFTLITNLTRGFAWLQKQAMKIAILFIVITVTFRIFLLLPPPILWYDVLIPLLAVGAISLYLWYGWIKVKNSSTRAVTTSFTSEV